MIFLDTSTLVDSLTGLRRCHAILYRLVDRNEGLRISTIVLYEWLRGPRTAFEIEAQELLLPSESAVPFLPADARLAANLYQSVRRARTREADIAIAATAIHHDAALWTLNTADFADIPGLRLYSP